MPSLELVSLVDGEWTDVPLHEALLAVERPGAIRIGVAAARRAGLSEAQIEALYGPEHRQPRNR